MASTTSLKVWLFAGHLAAIVCGAGHLFPSWNSGTAGRVFRWYGTMSGSSNSYGFFAPAVGAQHRARFQLEDGTGQTWEDQFDDTNNLEARLRLTGIVEDPFMSGEAHESPELRNRLVRSWAATMFNRHPNATKVNVVVEFLDIPTIAEYREGASAKWETTYEAQMVRHSDQTLE